MFLLKSIDLIALLSLLAQAFVTLIFVGILAAIGRREPHLAGFRLFFAAFTTLAVALGVMSLRFFRTHDIEPGYTLWVEGNWLPTLCYSVYLAFKGLFAWFLVRGCRELAGLPRIPQRWPWFAAIAALSLAPWFVPSIDTLLAIQAPLIVVSALLALRALTSLENALSGLSIVRWALIGLAASWVVHAITATGHGQLRPLQAILSLNSVVDLGVELMLGTGLVITILQEAHRRALESERERQMLREQIERDEKLRALGTLVSGVAHELNNPLMVILGYAEMLSGTEHHKEGPRIIAEQAERCRGIVRGLSALAGQAVHPRELLDGVALAQRVIRGLALEALCEGRRIELRSLQKAMLVSDRIGLEQVLSNLAINALHACPSGGLVTISVLDVRTGIHFLVEDDGPGIPPAQRAQIFEPFYTTKPPGMGIGMGLAIAHAIVRSLGGTITVSDAANGRGARFCVALPHTLGSLQPETLRALSSGRRLLVIEDDPAVRLLVRRQAERRGWTVSEADSAERVLEDAEAVESYDALLCDVRMAGIGGVGLHDRLLTENPRLLSRIVFYSGDHASKELRSFSKRCKRPLLHKPFDFNELFARFDLPQRDV